MKKWEYKFVKEEIIENLEEKLNEAGKEGWRVIKVNDTFQEVLLEREKKE